MGTSEFVSGPGVLIVLYVLFLIINEEGVIGALGEIGKGVWFLIKMYLIIVPVFIVLWVLSIIGMTEQYPTLSWFLAFLSVGAAYVVFVEPKNKEKDDSDKGA